MLLLFILFGQTLLQESFPVVMFTTPLIPRFEDEEGESGSVPS